MGKTKDRGRYQSISLSVDFIQEVKKHIMKDNQYKSVADFARAAMREKMERNISVKKIEHIRNVEYKDKFKQKFGVPPSKDNLHFITSDDYVINPHLQNELNMLNDKIDIIKKLLEEKK